MPFFVKSQIIHQSVNVLLLRELIHKHLWKLFGHGIEIWIWK